MKQFKKIDLSLLQPTKVPTKLALEEKRVEDKIIKLLTVTPQSSQELLEKICCSQVHLRRILSHLRYQKKIIRKRKSYYFVYALAGQENTLTAKINKFTN